jgi:hypothetical protein
MSDYDYSVYRKKEDQDNSKYLLKIPQGNDISTDPIAMTCINNVFNYEYTNQKFFLSDHNDAININKYHESVTNDFCGPEMNGGYLRSSISNSQHYALIRTIQIQGITVLHSIMTFIVASPSEIKIDAFCTNQISKLKGGNILMSRLVDICSILGITEIDLESVPDSKTLSYYKHQQYAQSGQITPQGLIPMRRTVRKEDSKAFINRLIGTGTISNHIIHNLSSASVRDINNASSGKSLIKKLQIKTMKKPLSNYGQSQSFAFEQSSHQPVVSNYDSLQLPLQIAPDRFNLKRNQYGNQIPHYITQGLAQNNPNYDIYRNDPLYIPYYDGQGNRIRGGYKIKKSKIKKSKTRKCKTRKCKTRKYKI